MTDPEDFNFARHTVRPPFNSEHGELVHVKDRLARVERALRDRAKLLLDQDLEGRELQFLIDTIKLCRG